jgi:hypothetical protein
LLLQNREKLEKLELLIPDKFEISYISDKTGFAVLKISYSRGTI